LIYQFCNRTVVPSVVVLPFQYESANPEAEYILDGITESIINSLSQLSKLRVIARTTAFTYKGREADPKKLGNELGVQFALTGKAIFRADSLVVQADLVDLATGSQIWGNKYDRNRSEILSIQEEIAREIAEKLNLKLTAEQRQRLTERYTQNNEAYDLYMRGLYHWNKRKLADVEKASSYFTQAFGKDQNYALAYAGLASCYIWKSSTLPPLNVMPLAKVMAAKALDLKKSLAEAHTTLAAVSLLHDWDWAAAERSFEQAIELKPTGYPTAYQWYADYLAAMGRHDEALVKIKRAQEIDPSSIAIRNDLARFHFYAQHYNDAIAQLKDTLQLDPNSAGAHTLLGLNYAKKEKFAEAVDELQKAVALSGDSKTKAMLGYAYALAGRRADAQLVLNDLDTLAQVEYVSPFFPAVVCAGLNDKEQAFAWLNKALADRSDYLAYLNVIPTLDSLRSDPRFKALVRQVGLPQ
jgi:TolB-like protein/Flp pilus assembly protein TadD